MKCVTFVFLFQGLFSFNQALRCFECTDTPKPRFCDKLTTCVQGERCYVESVITSSGTVLYNSGCSSAQRCLAKRSTDITLCHTCCTKDFCNKEGCGAVDLPNTQRGPYCLGCKYSLEPYKCTNVQFCYKNEKCSISQNNPLSLSSHQSVYEQTCSRQTMCALANITCCDGDFCNTNYTGSNQNTHSVTSSVTSSSTKMTTSTTQNPDHTMLRMMCDRNINDGYFYDSTSNVCFKLYKNLSTSITYNEANQACNKLGAQLLSIHSNKELDAIYYAIFSKRANDTSYWIGAQTNTSGSLVYHWTDGTSMNLQNFEHPYSGQPDSPWASNEHCVYLNYKDQYKWHDDECNSTKSGYICEIGSSYTGDKGRMCITHSFSGYILQENMCIKLPTVNTTRTYTRDEANGACQQDGGSLVTVDNNNKMDAILRLIFTNHGNATDYWIGAYADPKAPGQFVWPSGASTSPYTNWGGVSKTYIIQSQPDTIYQHEDDERCVYMDHVHDYYWFDANCNTKLNGYICQFRGKNNTRQECLSHLYNKQYWYDRETDTCFSVKSQINVNKKEAEDHCKAEGSTLLSVTNQRILDVVWEQIFFTHSNGSDFWLGGRYVDHQGFVWEATNQKFGFTHWYHVDSKDCVIMDYKNQYKWSPRSCSASVHGYICRINYP